VTFVEDVTKSAPEDPNSKSNEHKVTLEIVQDFPKK
jgi:hypothetical protein